MSKINDMAMTIEELRNAAAAINDLANWLTTAVYIRCSAAKRKYCRYYRGKIKICTDP